MFTATIKESTSIKESTLRNHKRYMTVKLLPYERIKCHCHSIDRGVKCCQSCQSRRILWEGGSINRMTFCDFVRRKMQRIRPNPYVIIVCTHMYTLKTYIFWDTNGRFLQRWHRSRRETSKTFFLHRLPPSTVLRKCRSSFFWILLRPNRITTPARSRMIQIRFWA